MVYLYSYLNQTGKHRQGSKGVCLYNYLTQTGKHRQGSKGVCLYSYLNQTGKHRQGSKVVCLYSYLMVWFIGIILSVRLSVQIRVQPVTFFALTLVYHI